MTMLITECQRLNKLGDHADGGMTKFDRCRAPNHLMEALILKRISRTLCQRRLKLDPTGAAVPNVRPIEVRR